jgi:DNA-directed RNA polymerase subunit RPC12/RpoP
MSLQPRIQENELYRCTECNKEYKYIEVKENWKCPECGKYLYIKISIGKYEHSCQRVNPIDLRKGEIITLENVFIHEILDIKKSGVNYRVALKGYRVIEVENDSIITRIEGGWY